MLDGTCLLLGFVGTMLWGGVSKPRRDRSIQNKMKGLVTSTEDLSKGSLKGKALGGRETVNQWLWGKSHQAPAFACDSTGCYPACACTEGLVSVEQPGRALGQTKCMETAITWSSLDKFLTDFFSFFY